MRSLEGLTPSARRFGRSRTARVWLPVAAVFALTLALGLTPEARAVLGPTLCSFVQGVSACAH